MERCSTTVIVNGTLIDGSGNPPTPNEAIVIEGNRIRSTGALPADMQIEDQDQMQVIDATGQWILPGLIDGHCHLSFGFPEMSGVPSSRGTTSAEFSTLRAARNAQTVLRSGVTSLSVPGGTWFIDVAVRDAVAAGLIEGRIIDDPRGQNGFGYDPHFWIPTLGCTTAELPSEHKNRISHRGQALSAMLAEITRLRS